MKRRTRSLDAAYFEELYGREADPWSFETSEYEAAKYSHTIAVLGKERARRAFELGCSIGVLTRRLAGCCDQLMSTDISRTALARARRRCADLGNVRFALARGVGDGLEGSFDLIVLSEVVYYWDDLDLDSIAAAVLRTLESSGRLLMVHWLGETDYPHSADGAVAALRSRLANAFTEAVSERRESYRLDLWRRTP